jgi:hypothetical protein
LGAEDQFEKSRKEGQRERERERESLLLDLTVFTFTAFTNHCRDRDPKKLQFLEPKRGFLFCFIPQLCAAIPFILQVLHLCFFFFYLGFWVLFKIQLL